MSEIISAEEFSAEIAKATNVADSNTIQEITKLVIESYSLRNSNYAQNIEQRRQFAQLIFILVCLWLLIVIMIVVATGKGDLRLSDTVLSILLGTTTANVCSFLFFVVKYLFNVEEPKRSDKRESSQSKKKKKKKNTSASQ